MPKLVFINKNFEEQTYELIVEKTTVGRGTHNTLVICDNSVSTRHCEILMNGNEIIVCDLDSSNGTFINGMRLNKQSQAMSGSIIRFGLVEARLQLEEPVYKDGDTQITAFYDLEVYQRKQRREQKKPKPALAGKVEPSVLGQADDGHTVLLPRPPVPLPSANTEPVQDDDRPGFPLKVAFVFGVVLLGIGLLLWWWWSRP